MQRRTLNPGLRQQTVRSHDFLSAEDPGFPHAFERAAAVPVHYTQLVTEPSTIELLNGNLAAAYPQIAAEAKARLEQVPA